MKIPRPQDSRFGHLRTFPNENFARFPPPNASQERPSLSRQPPNQLGLFLAVRLSIRPENFMKPDRRLAVGIRMFPRIPRQICLRPARHEPPPPLPLSGSFHTSQPSTRSSLPNAFTTPFT